MPRSVLQRLFVVLALLAFLAGPAALHGHNHGLSAAPHGDCAACAFVHGTSPPPPRIELPPVAVTFVAILPLPAVATAAARQIALLSLAPSTSPPAAS